MAELIGDAEIRVDMDTDEALQSLQQFTRDAEGRLRDLRGRFVTESDVIGRSLGDAGGATGRFGNAVRSIQGAVAGAAASIGRLGASVGGVVPVVAGLVTNIGQVPAAGAAAVAGLLAVRQASAALELGMVGVEEAVTAAFDTSEEGAERFQDALESLSPSAQRFARVIRDSRDDLVSFQQSVQEELFAGLDEELRNTATATLPIFQTNLQRSARALNDIGQGVASSVRGLAESGTLGKALSGANAGLENLTKVPGRVVTALAQLAAAGAPALDLLTTKVDEVSGRISERLSGAFESGALTDAVNEGVGVLGQLAGVAANVIGTLRNVFTPLQEAGVNVLGVLERVTGALRSATGAAAFQETLRVTAGVVGNLSDAVFKLLGFLGRLTNDAVSGLAPALSDANEGISGFAEQIREGLSGGLENIDWGSVGKTIGSGLAGAVEAAVQSAGRLTSAFADLLGGVDWVGIGISLGQQVPALLAGLVTGLLTFDLGSLLSGLADNWSEVLLAILSLAFLPARLIGVIGRLLARIPIVGRLLAWVLQWSSALARQMVSAVGRALGFLGRAFVEGFRRIFPAVGSQLAVQLSLLPTRIGVFGLELLAAGRSAVRRLGDGIANASAWVAAKVGELIAVVLRPFARVIGQLLQRGSALVAAARTAMVRFRDVIVSRARAVVEWVRGLPGRFRGALSTLGGSIARVATSALTRFRQLVVSGATGVVSWLRGLPGRVVSALSALGGRLAGVASSAFARFRAAAAGRVSSLIGWVAGIPGRIRGALGNVGGFLYSAGRSIIQGLINGIQSAIGGAVGAVRSGLSRVRNLLPFSPAKEGPFSGRGWTLYSGRALVEGLAQGIEQRSDAVRRAALGMLGGAGLATPGVGSVVSAAPRGVAAASRADALRPGVVHVTFVNHGPIGSQRELEDWLVKSLDRLARQSRLPAASRGR